MKKRENTAKTNTRVSLKETELYKIRLGIMKNKINLFTSMRLLKKIKVKNIKSLFIKATEVIESKENIGIKKKNILLTRILDCFKPSRLEKIRLMLDKPSSLS